jgi:hypothetical protein
MVYGFMTTWKNLHYLRFSCFCISQTFAVEKDDDLGGRIVCGMLRYNILLGKNECQQKSCCVDTMKCHIPPFYNLLPPPLAIVQDQHHHSLAITLYVILPAD